jgi:2-phosphoglycerate kinase
MSGLVYLLGGSSSVGKTTAAATVAQRLGAAHVQVDAIAQASQDPRVRRFQADVDELWSLPAAQVCELLIEKGEALAAQVDAIIRRCSASAPITVVEGEGIHPSLARQHPAGGLARFVFVVEPEQAVLFQTLTSRSARFRALPAAHQHTVAATNWLYGHWLRRQALQFGQPWIQSRPWATMPDRLLQAWQRPTPEPRATTVIS